MFLSFLNNSWCRIHDWNTLKIVFFKNWLCMCICIWVCTCECRCLQRPEIAKHLELEWKENHELPNMDGWYVLNTKLGSSGWSANTATYPNNSADHATPTLKLTVSERSNSNWSFYPKQDYSFHCFFFGILFVFGIWLFLCNILCCIFILFFF